MTPLEAAHRLATADICEDGTGRCILNFGGGFNVRAGTADHGPDCPSLALPQIVAALEAYEKVTG